MEQKENKMGILPVKRLIISMSLPMMASMLVQALYNVVDSIFVAQIDEAALTAVTLAFPLQNLMIALGSGTGVGMNALLSRSLGEKRFDRSNAAANTTLLLTLINYLVFLIVGLFFVEPFIRTQTSDPQIIQYGVTYLRIICCVSMGIFFQMTFERMLQSTGRTLFSMVSQMSGALINIIMDPILIFGLLGFPKMGVAGAAAATVLKKSDVIKYNKNFSDDGKDWVKSVGEPINNSKTYYLYRKDETELQKAVDGALKTLKDNGTLSELAVKWVGYDVTEEE